MIDPTKDPNYTLPPYSRGKGVFVKFSNANSESYGTFVCPGCGSLSTVDEDMARGRVSMRCTIKGCSFHETRVLV